MWCFTNIELGAYIKGVHKVQGIILKSKIYGGIGVFWDHGGLCMYVQKFVVDDVAAAANF